MSAVPAPTAQRSSNTVGVFSPAGREAGPERVARARGYFESQGDVFVPSTSDTASTRFAATDRERAAELERVIRDPAIDVAMALRGGYGCTRLLPRLDFAALAEALRTSGQRLVGHSDLTVIQLALLKAGATTFAGPMVAPDFGAETIDDFMVEHFRRAMDERRVEASFETRGSPFVSSGVLWGGNLTMIASLIGTPWMPEIEGGILFVEDVNERPYRVERALLQLQQAGILDRQHAVLCGEFSGWKPFDSDNGYGIDDALEHLRSVTSVPIVTGLPFGHVPRKLTLAVGVPAEVTVTRGTCRLLQTW